MKKTFKDSPKGKVVMLPTSNNSSIAFVDDNHTITLSYGKDYRKEDSPNFHVSPQHLYIVSDEEIKEGDWFIGERNTGKKLLKAKKIFKDKGFIQNEQGEYPYDINESKKVITSTDKLLLGSFMGYDTDSGIDCSDYLPQIPESFVKAYIKAYNEGKPITEVDLEMNSATNQVPNGKTIYWLKTRPDNTVIIHQSKTYTREEVIKLITKFNNEAFLICNIPHIILTNETRDKWIEENL